MAGKDGGMEGRSSLTALIKEGMEEVESGVVPLKG
jgi:hypothetical protein